MTDQRSESADPTVAPGIHVTIGARGRWLAAVSVRTAVDVALGICAVVIGVVLVFGDDLPSQWNGDPSIASRLAVAVVWAVALLVARVVMVSVEDRARRTSEDGAPSVDS